MVAAPGVSCPSAFKKGIEELIGASPVSDSGLEAFGLPSASASISIREKGRATGAACSAGGSALGEVDWFWAGLRAGPDDGCSSDCIALLKTVAKCRGVEASCEAGGFPALAGDVWPLELRFDAATDCEGSMPGSGAAGPDKRFTRQRSAGQRPNNRGAVQYDRLLARRPLSPARQAIANTRSCSGAGPKGAAQASDLRPFSSIVFTCSPAARTWLAGNA